MKPRKVPSRIREILAEQKSSLAGLSRGHQRRLVRIARELQRDLETQLRQLAPGRFSAQQTRVVLAQVRGVVDVLGARTGVQVSREMTALATGAASVGRDSLIAQVDHWADEFRGSVRAIARPELAAELLSPGLLELHSIQRYGAGAITQMRDVMARSTLAGETLSQTSAALADEMALPPWQAERIVRTEQSRAMHVRQRDDMIDMFGEDEVNEEWLKQLLATFDDRTGEDSKFVHQQAVAPDKPFKDNLGNSYMLPPNRPNDREVMLYIPRVAAIAQ